MRFAKLRKDVRQANMSLDNPDIAVLTWGILNISLDLFL